MKPDSAKLLARILLLAAVYALAAKLGLSFAFGFQQVTTIWPPTGIALAALVLFGYRFWPGVTLGAFVANVLTNEPIWVAGLIALGNTAEALAGAYILKRLRFDRAISRFRDVFGLILTALSTPVIAATIGTASLLLGQLTTAERAGDVWSIWWIGDMAGIMVFGSLILVLNRTGLRLLLNRVYEAGIFLALVFAVSMLIFTRPEPRGYFIFPLFVWGALRFKQAGVVAASMVLMLTSVWATLHDMGMFSFATTTEANLIALHTFFFTVLVTGLILASSVSAREKSEQALINQTKELESEKRRVLKEIRDRGVLEQQLREANQRITDILAGILDESAPRREPSSNDKH